jgi:hypothetical protein
VHTKHQSDYARHSTSLGVAAMYSEIGQLGVDRRIPGLAEQLGISREAIVSTSRFTDCSVL